ncbi:unnamed protein product, partial [Nesidiocoris tenuis]
NLKDPGAGYSYEVVHDYPASAQDEKQPQKETPPNNPSGAAYHVYGYDEDGPPDVSANVDDHESSPFSSPSKPSHGSDYNHEENSHHNYSPSYTDHVSPSAQDHNFQNHGHKKLENPPRGPHTQRQPVNVKKPRVKQYSVHETDAYVPKTYFPKPSQNPPLKYGDRIRKPKWSSTSGSGTGGFLPNTVADINDGNRGSVYSHATVTQGGIKGQASGPGAQVSVPDVNDVNAYSSLETGDGRIIVHHHRHKETIEHYPGDSDESDDSKFDGYPLPLGPPPVIHSVKIETTVGHVNDPGGVSKPGEVSKPGGISKPFVGSPVDHLTSGFPVFQESDFVNLGLPAEGHDDSPLVDHSSVKGKGKGLSLNKGHSINGHSTINGRPSYKGHSSNGDHSSVYDSNSINDYSSQDLSQNDHSIEGHSSIDDYDDISHEGHPHKALSFNDNPHKGRPFADYPQTGGSTFGGNSPPKKILSNLRTKIAQFHPEGKKGRWRPVVVTKSKKKGKLRTFRISKDFKPGKLEEGFQPSFGPVPGHFVSEHDDAKSEIGDQKEDEHFENNEEQQDHSSELDTFPGHHDSSLHDYLSPPPVENDSKSYSNEENIDSGSKSNSDSSENKSLKDYHNSLTTPSLPNFGQTKTSPRLKYHRSKLLSLFPIHVPPLRTTTTVDHTIATTIESKLPTVKLSSYLSTPPIKILGRNSQDQATSYANSNGVSLTRPHKRKNG